MKRMITLLLISILLISGCSQTTNNESNEESKATKEDFPTKPIEMILPFPTGGSYTIFGRILAETVQKYLPNNESVVVINKDGGNNTLGLVELFKAKPDGYTIGFVPSSSLTITPHYGDTPYTYNSFQTISRVISSEGYLFVKSDAPWQTFEEWTDYVKENPGKFTVGAVPSSRPTIERMNREIGTEVTIVPFNGFAEGISAFLGGHTDGIIATMTTDLKGLLESGDVKPLFSTALSTPNDVPTLKEKGYSIEENKMVGLIAPKGISEERLNILHEAFKKALEDPELVAEYQKLGMQPHYAGPEEFQQMINDGFQYDGENLKASGLIK